MGHTVISATLASSVTVFRLKKIGKNEIYCNFENFNRVVDIKTSFIEVGPDNIKYCLENQSKPTTNF